MGGSVILLFNKPYRVLSQFGDKDGKQTLAEFITVRHVYPAGRLDYDSEGLLILTDDGHLQQRIAHPRFGKEKEYWVQVEGIPSESDLDRLRRGIGLKDGPTRPARVRRIEDPPVWDRVPPIRKRRQIPTAWLSLTLSEGRNRQVRRMTAQVGYPTLRLIRCRIGHWTLEGIPVGEYRVL